MYLITKKGCTLFSKKGSTLITKKGDCFFLKRTDMPQSQINAKMQKVVGNAFTLKNWLI